jgi:hypothetical protein
MGLTTSSRHSPAILVAALGLVAALAGTAVGGDSVATTSALNKKKVKKLVRKEVSKQIANATGPQGSAGPQGPAGPPGKDATALFAYVRDPLPSGAAAVGYGRGATNVAESSAPGAYVVSFNRNLQNCVAQVNAGTGDPGGTGSFENGSIAQMNLAAGTANQLQVSMFDPETDSFSDSSFLVSVFC